MQPTEELASLARDLPLLALGAILLATGLIALLLRVVHRAARGVPLTAFGAIVLLYGLRLFTEQPSFRAVAVGPALLWDYIIAICTYLLIPVVFVFVEHFLGPGWRSSIRRVWQVHLVYAVSAIAIDIGTGTPLATVSLNNVLVVVWMVVVLANLAAGAFRLDREIRIVRVGLGVLVILIIHDNLAAGGLGLLPWSLSLEPVGAVIMVGCLGYALALRTFGNERRLATLDHELRTARRIQRSLLPAELPRLPGAELAVRYIPMAAVGGDLYDCMQISDHHLGLLVADVAGHGIPAALIASMVKTAAVAQSRVADKPAELLEGINRRLCGQVDGHYVTAAYVYVNLDTGQLRHASAGHPPPFFVSRTDQTVHAIGDSGLLLGFMPDARYTTTELALTPGDRLVLYTDGVVEAASPSGEFFDPMRLREMLQQHTELSPETWADRLLERLTEWSGKPALELDDDLTLVVLDLS